MEPDPGSESFSETNPETIGPLGNHGARTEVSPKVVWEGAGTRFPHPKDVLMRSGELRKLILRAAQPFVQCNYLRTATIMRANVLYPFLC